jgi:hypothetical protein
MLLAIGARGAAAEDMRAHVDPATGALSRQPHEPAQAGPAHPAQSRTGADLVEEPAPGGGVMMDLHGRFHAPLVATVTPDGSVRVEHRPAP